MGSRALAIGLAAAGLLGSSCASTARDALIDIYNDEAGATGFDDACRVEERTLATATDAYVAANGAAPTSTDDLVPDWIREEPVDWEFDAASPTSFSPVAGGRCDGVDLESTDSSIGQKAVDRIEDANGATCATDKRQVETGLELHFALNGFDAQTIDDLLEIGVDVDPERWTLEPSADPEAQTPVVVAVVGGPCDG